MILLLFGASWLQSYWLGCSCYILREDFVSLGYRCMKRITFLGHVHAPLVLVSLFAAGFASPPAFQHISSVEVDGVRSLLNQAQTSRRVLVCFETCYPYTMHYICAYCSPTVFWHVCKA